MANLTIRRSTSRKQRVLRTARRAGAAVALYVKARIAWLAAKKAARVAAPAVVVGTAAVVAKKRHDNKVVEVTVTGVDAVPPAPAGMV